MKNQSFIKDNLILFVGLFFAGFFSYIFHFVMGRMLGPVEYGDLNTIVAINYIIIVFFNTIQTSVTLFTAKYKSKGEYGKIKNLIKSFSGKLLGYSLIIGLIFSITIPFLGRFLNLNNHMILIWVIPMVIISLLYPITRGVLQGLQKFPSLSFSYIAEGFIKIVLALGLVLIGLKIHGAVAAIVLGLILTYPLTFKPLKKIFKTKIDEINKKEIYSYSFPVLFAILLLTLMYSMDILLVKHYFPAVEAGYYSALAILSKVIFFSIVPLTQVMFPKITEAKENGQNYLKILFKTLFISCLIIAIILLMYWRFPELMVGILFGKDYLEIAQLLGMIGLMMSFFSLAYLFCFYNLSINNKGFTWIVLFFLLVEMNSIVFFHNSLFTVVRNLTVIMFLFLLSIIIYSVWTYKKVY
ncbi:MAG: oligosaccharide flippase family protein [archaeon]